MKITKRFIFTAASIAGTVITAVLAAKGGTEAEKILSECENRDQMTLLEKAKKVAPVYIPAAATTAITVAMEVASHNEGTAAIAAAGTTAAVGIKNIKKKFDKYRTAAKELDVHRDVAVHASTITNTGGIMDYEAQHTFCIDWTEDEPIYFDSTLGTVMDAMAKINRRLVDLSYGDGQASVSDFLNDVGHKELTNYDTDNAGWEIHILECECEAYWIDSWIYKRSNEDVYDIKLEWYPNYDLQTSIEEWERRYYR